MNLFCSFYDEADRFASSKAERGHSSLCSPVSHGVKQGGKNPSATGANRVSKSDRPAVDMNRLIEAAVSDAVANRMRGVESRLAVLEAGSGHNGKRRRFDAFERNNMQPVEEHDLDGGAAAPAEKPAPQDEPSKTESHPRRRVVRRISGGRKAGVDWTSVRRFYVKCRKPKETAAKFDLSLNTVKARIRREKWAAGRDVEGVAA